MGAFQETCVYNDVKNIIGPRITGNMLLDVGLFLSKFTRERKFACFVSSYSKNGYLLRVTRWAPKTSYKCSYNPL